MRTLLRTALLAGILVLAAGGLWVRHAMVQVPVEDGTAKLLQIRLAGEYAAAITADPDRGLLEKGRALLDLERIRLVSLSALVDDEARVLRARITVDGGPPPDGRSVRYFRMEPIPLGGWAPAGEASALDYYRRLF